MGFRAMTHFSNTEHSKTLSLMIDPIQPLQSIVAPVGEPRCTHIFLMDMPR